MKTRVLLSSIFFIADSVFNGLNEGRDNERGAAELDFWKDDLRDDYPVLVHTRSMINGFPWILGCPRQTKRLGPVEGDRSSDLSLCLRVCSHKSGLFSIFGLGLLGSRGLGWG